MACAAALGFGGGARAVRTAPAADRQQNDRDASRAARQEVELFAGIEQQQLEVQLIPRDASQCRLLISNKTDQPLSVKLPEAFAGVPVLAQFGLPRPGPWGRAATLPLPRPGQTLRSASAARRPPTGRPAPL